MNDRLPRIETTSCTASTTTNSSSSALDIPSAASTTSDGSAKDLQTEPFQQNDVLLGRGKKFRNHPGNKRYTDLINENCDSYFSLHDLENRAHKRRILANIVDTILEQGRFLKREGRDWVPVAREQALLKTAHAIRYQQRKTTHDGTKECDLDINQAPLLLSLDMTAQQLPLELTHVGYVSWNQLSPITASQHMAFYNQMVPGQEYLVRPQFMFADEQEQSIWPPKCLPGRLSSNTVTGSRTTKRGRPKNEVTLNALPHRSNECYTTSTKLSSSNYDIFTKSNGDGYIQHGEHGDGGSYDNVEVVTLPGLARVTSIGSFATVDEPMDVCRCDMNW